MAFRDVGLQNVIFETPHPMSALGVKSPHLQFSRVDKLRATFKPHILLRHRTPELPTIGGWMWEVGRAPRWIASPPAEPGGFALSHNLTWPIACGKSTGLHDPTMPGLPPTLLPLQKQSPVTYDII